MFRRIYLSVGSPRHLLNRWNSTKPKDAKEYLLHKNKKRTLGDRLDWFKTPAGQKCKFSFALLFFSEWLFL